MKLRVSHRLRIVGLAVGLFAGCFRQVPTSSVFHYECTSDDECSALLDNDGEPMLDANGDPFVERCIQGLCQYPCGGSLVDLFNPMADNGCPPDNNFFCFNGTCTNLCDGAVDPPPCSAPHTCIEFASLDTFAGSEDAAAYLEMLPSERSGLCGVLCEDAEDCPEGQLCLSGVCLDLSGFGTTGTTGTGTTTDVTSTDGSDTDATTGGTGP